jgi:glycosyltransferase involved in cell wall biosynthesis
VRIAHVVTLVSADGSFGGPLSVAVGQIRELAARGHAMTLYAGWDGAGTVDLPRNVDVRLHKVRALVPRGSLSGVMAVGLPFEIDARSDAHDVIHLHQGRDLLTASAGWMAHARSLPYVVQTHGMIGPDDRQRAKLIDALSIRRVLTDAARVLSLNEEEDLALQQVLPGIRTTRLRNGIDEAPELPGPDPDARPVVLFMARLNRRKRVMAFALLAVALLERGVDADFVATGPDEGDLKEFLDFVAEKGWSERIRYEGAVEPSRVRERLASATVYVLPSVDEPFPMTVLEALSVGTPTVVTDSCHIGADLAERGAVTVSPPAASQLTEAVHELLIDPDKRAAMGEAGRRAIREAYGIGPVVDQLELAYASALASAPAIPSVTRRSWRRGRG